MTKKGAQDRLNVFGYWFTLPFIVVFLIFNLWPTVYTFLLSFGDMKGLKTSFSLVGLVNFKKLISDPYLGCCKKHIYHLGLELCSSARYCPCSCNLAY